MKIIDTHTHYAHKTFNGKQNKILNDLLSCGEFAAVIEAAIGFDSNEKMLKLCREHANVYAAVGVHPNCLESFTEEQFEKVKEMIQKDKVLAIGETGLDYYRKTSSKSMELQKTWFRRFIELSLETKKPLVIHSRKLDDDLVEILSEYKDRFEKYPGIVHCFSGEKEHAEKLIEMGFFLGVGGKFSDDLKITETLKDIPLDAIVLETDCPFLLPKGLTDSPNTSLNLPYIVKQLAEIKGVEEQEILEAALKNTVKVYPVFEKFLR